LYLLLKQAARRVIGLAAYGAGWLATSKIQKIQQRAEEAGPPVPFLMPPSRAL
jgi:hypothetical protein